MDASELRTVTLEEGEIRAEGSGSRQQFRFRGYALTYGTLSHELLEPGVNRSRPFRERVLAGAARETIAKDEIRHLLNHKRDQLLGRTSSGTLRLAEDSRGVHVDTLLPDTSYARDYAELVQRGDASEMSFRFYAPLDRFTSEGGGSVRELERFRIREVSSLTEPAAYPQTEAHVSLEAARALAHAEEELRAGRVLSSENVAALQQLIEDIEAIIERAAGAKPDPADAGPSRSLELLRRRLAIRERLA